MANSEKAYGVGVSYRTPDGTLIWVFRSEWAEVLTDLGVMYGPDAVLRLNGQMATAFGDGKQSIAQMLTPPAQPAQPVYTPQPQASAPVPQPVQPQAESESGQSFEMCPACGAEKNRWVPPGVSSKTGKKYPGFYGCPTRGCSGR
jgi:hypothetical protein